MHPSTITASDDRHEYLSLFALQIVTASYTDLQDYTYYFVPAPWLSVKLLRLLQNYPPPGWYTFI